MLPSKELLSAVFGVKVYDYGSYGNSMIEYSTNRGADLSRYRTINIYELMHLMKEWAYDNGYAVIVYKSSDEYTVMVFEAERFYLNTDYLNRIVKFCTTDTDTGFEAVTKACEWILKETK